MNNGMANYTAVQITQQIDPRNAGNMGARYVAVPMKDGVSQYNKRCQWCSNRVLQVFILMLKKVLGQTHVCAYRLSAAKCHITTDVIYCCSLRSCDMLYVMTQNNVTTK